METILPGIVFIIILFGYITIASITRGFVVACYWGWFVVPIFGLHPLTLVQALAVSLVVSILTVGSYRPYQDPEESAWSRMGYPFLIDGIALVMGYIVKQFM